MRPFLPRLVFGIGQCQISAMAHIPEEVLEEYALGRVAEPALSEVEQHLLVCEHCREVVTEVDRMRAILRAAERAGRGSNE